ncbi:nb-arc domain containing protein [Fusarium agapanthi]|uniref:Nb-arc domain containing protein n=1 Tax=Fusarium agapanthi TaxID=1803897 RepID=A0A9P5E5M1_9HYPO|nr:nb-arc domain containing protein [Fusarium agapanthi]
MLNRAVQRFVRPSLGFLERSQRPGQSQYPPIIATISFSSRARLENCPQNNITKVLESIWRPDVLAEAKEHSGRAGVYLNKILKFSEQVCGGELSNNARTPPIMDDVMRAVGSEYSSTSQANSLSTPPQDLPDAGPALPEISQDDLDSLFTLLCCLADFQIPADLLCSGARGTYSWADDGSVTFRESTINARLRRLLVDKPLLSAALQQLEHKRLIRRYDTQGSWIVHSSLRNDRLRSLGGDSSSRWKLEALELVFSAIPLKNINDYDPPLDKLMLRQHIEHTIAQLRDAHGTYQIPSELIYVVINGLLESSFYPGRPWKEWSIGKAKHLSDSTLNVDPYLPKVLRFQGRFEGSRERLKMVHTTFHEWDRLPWSDLKGAYALQMADTMLCLKEYSQATHGARFVLDNPRYSLDLRATAYVVLAECLMEGKLQEAEHYLFELRRECTVAAEQKRKDRAEPAGDSSIGEVSGLSKEAKLRYHISMAKLAHLRRDWESAERGWTKALNAVNKIPPRSGHTTRIILLSQREVFLQLGRSSLADETKMNIVLLEKVSANSEANYWIPRFMEWQDYLKAHSSSQIAPS